MIDKKSFCNAIESIEKQNKIDIEFAENMGKCFPESFSANLLPNTYTCKDGLIKLLKAVMRDKYDYIEYFCWELDFGAENYRLKATDANGKNIPLRNASDLYKMLKKDYETK